MEHCEEASVSRSLTEWALTEWALGGGLFRVFTLMLPLPQGYMTLNPALLGECAMNCGAYTKALQVIVSAVCNC